MKKYKWFFILISIVILSCSSLSLSIPEEQRVGKNIELPSTVPGLLIEHTGFTLSYNLNTNCPDWVAWELTKEEAENKDWKRTDKFIPDPVVPLDHRVETRDYTRTGYDRGHMCPAADMHWSEEAMHDCFYMSNMCPQDPNLNRQWWEHLEEACRRWAGHEGRVYICCGPVWDITRQATWIGTKRKIQVPIGFFKVVLSLKRGEEKAIGFLYTNTGQRQTMEDAATSVDRVEEMTGLDFFPTLGDDLENKVEAMKDLKIWN